MIQHRSMTKSARSREVQYFFDLSSTTNNKVIVYEPDNNVKVQRIDLVYTTATSSHTQTETVDVGIVGNGTLYASILPAASTSIGTKTSITPSSDYVMPSGTPLTIARSAHVGSSNTGEVVVVVHYELLDNNVEA